MTLKHRRETSRDMARSLRQNLTQPPCPLTQVISTLTDAIKYIYVKHVLAFQRDTDTQVRFMG